MDPTRNAPQHARGPVDDLSIWREWFRRREPLAELLWLLIRLRAHCASRITGRSSYGQIEDRAIVAAVDSVFENWNGLRTGDGLRCGLCPWPLEDPVGELADGTRICGRCADVLDRARTRGAA